ncbi:MAG: dihydroneopterin aldolase [Gammaproteobacteria bacterium]
MDRVLIEGLTLEATIGIYEWERRIRQRLVLDLELGRDIARAAASDDIADALDYKAVAKRVRALVEGSSYKLVESLAETVATVVREEFGVPWLRVAVRKPGAVTGAANVGVVIERGVSRG